MCDVAEPVCVRRQLERRGQARLTSTVCWNVLHACDSEPRRARGGVVVAILGHVWPGVVMVTDPPFSLQVRSECWSWSKEGQKWRSHLTTSRPSWTRCCVANLCTHTHFLSPLPSSLSFLFLSSLSPSPPLSLPPSLLSLFR